AYAHERVQGGVAIIEHPDVKRMLLTMRSLEEAMRAMAYTEAVTMDLAHYGPEAERPAHQARVDLMIPVIKGWLTEIGQEMTSLGVQVHGGMGYVEETGSAQFLRDVRITSIYEGTNGIQAADLVNRKLGRDGGATMLDLLEHVSVCVNELKSAELPALQHMGAALADGLADLQASTATILAALKEDRARALGSSFDYMMQAGYLLGGWHLMRSALVAARRLAESPDNRFYQQKIATASFYAEQVLPRAGGYAGSVASGGGALAEYPVDWV
ncbi:MAG: acyl-CoA dehydrogenase C-terminal domain-containing protein, partial [Pseudomonadota bacterium]